MRVHHPVYCEGHTSHLTSSHYCEGPHSRDLTSNTTEVSLAATTALAFMWLSTLLVVLRANTALWITVYNSVLNIYFSSHSVKKPSMPSFFMKLVTLSKAKQHSRTDLIT